MSERPTRQLVPGGHAFVLDDEGGIDVWRLESGYHNGPQCAACDRRWCEHCDRDIFEESCPNSS